MKTIVPLLFLITLSGPTFDGGRPTGDMKGLRLVNRQIIDRLLDRNDPNSEAFRIEAVAGTAVKAQSNVLGSFSTGLPHNIFSGGEPNPYNVLLWHVLLDTFAETLAKTCSEHQFEAVEILGQDGFTKTTFKLDSSFSASLARACEWSRDIDERRDILESIWINTIGLGYEEEMLAWRGFFEERTNSAEQHLRDMLLAIMMNPYYLLAH